MILHRVDLKLCTAVHTAPNFSSLASYLSATKIYLNMKKYVIAATLLIASLASASAQAPPDDYFAVGAGLGSSYGAIGVKAQKSLKTGNIPGAASIGMGVYPAQEVLLAYSFNYKMYLFDNFEVFYVKMGFETTGHSWDTETNSFGYTFKTNFKTDENFVIGAGIDTWIDDHIALNLGSGVGLDGGLLLDVGFLVSW